MADRYIGVFAGMAPADNPRVVVAVMINEPSDGKYFGGEVAAPVFARVAEGVLRFMHVPPELKAGAVSMSKVSASDGSVTKKGASA